MRLCLAAVLLACAPAWAQVDAVFHDDPTRGLTLLPDGAAYASGATAAQYNPAGVVHSGLLEAFYAHERAIGRGLVSDGVYFGASPVDFVGLGVSFEWLRGAGDDHRKTRFTLGAGGDALSGCDPFPVVGRRETRR